ncbi:hypothetical protein T4B_2413 [Trichinella pseudospiralis]|uniref:Uncharacterized protein n=1 Tax=Trichinella pseudospiralis TaxID=6337 RepID=A0A0V1JYK3_TRIPS|nr:hypothetical protein T4A_6794 [Trichinella pseudospiralis]KRZ33157.1 hypothetical protein T4B_2413 [Trichinella pseudospiralis]KRZ39605.1 hypothetical protein T4C_12125 [Trichinella pseudospiralis]
MENQVRNYTVGRGELVVYPDADISESDIDTYEQLAEEPFDTSDDGMINGLESLLRQRRFTVGVLAYSKQRHTLGYLNFSVTVMDIEILTSILLIPDVAGTKQWIHILTARPADDARYASQPTE